MMIKGHSYKVRIAVACIALGALVSTGWYSWHTMTAVHRYTLDIDTHLSPATHAAIASFLAHEPSATSRNFHATFAALKQKFPCVHECEAELRKPGYVHYALSAAVPRIKINTTHVLTTTGELLAQHNFETSLLTPLPTITLTHLDPTTTQAPYGLVSFSQRVPRTLFADYTVTWVDNFEACAQRKDKTLSLLCNTDHVPDAALLERCNQIVASWPTPHPPLCVDVRFANQIVVHAEHKGDSSWPK